MNSNSYTYGGGKPHAVTNANGKNYTYDDNGNMTARGGDSLSWDVENHLITMTVSSTTTFAYDGDGTRVKKAVGGTTTYYVGNWYEKTGDGETKYYYHGGRLVALRRSGNGLYYVHADHLGSTMITTDNSDPVVKVAEQRFYPWGQATRYTSGTRRARHASPSCQCPQ